MLNHRNLEYGISSRKGTVMALMGTVIYHDIARLEWVQRLVVGAG